MVVFGMLLMLCMNGQMYSLLQWLANNVTIKQKYKFRF